MIFHSHIVNLFSNSWLGDVSLVLSAPSLDSGGFPVGWLLCGVASGMALMVLFSGFYSRRRGKGFQLETERRERMESDIINKERMMYYAGLTHELRQPVASLYSSLDELCRQTDLPAAQFRKLHEVRDGARKLLGLINDIFDFQRSERENLKLIVAKGDVGGYVLQMMSRIIELNPNENLTISVDIQPGLPTVYFDERVVSTVVRNLVNNALKYTLSGEITVSVRIIKLFDRHLIEISVKDTGIGIPQNKLQDIFDTYYRLPEAERRKGCGIGLAVVKMMAGIHEGEVMVKSEEGKGSEFSFCISVDSTYPDAEHLPAPQGFEAGILPQRNVALDMAAVGNVRDSRSVSEPIEIEVPQLAENDRRARVDAEFLHRLTDLVEENLSQSELDIKFIEDHLNMSRSSIFRRLKSLTGLSIVEYIRVIRLKASKELLRRGSAVSETAYACGFNDVGYFRTLFKREFGVSPSQFRRENLN